MLVCNVSLRPPRRAIAAELIEIGSALDASTTGQVVLATLVDDPASVAEFVDAYLGELMSEAASASESFDAGLAYLAAIDEAATIIDASDGTITVAPTGTTWNPSDKGSNITLSNGNLTVSITTGSGPEGVRAVSSRSTGKAYYEMTWSGQDSGMANTGCGFTRSGTLPVAVMSGAVIATRLPGGQIYYWAAYQAAIGDATPAGSTICSAIDLDTRKAWFRLNGGQWNGSGTADPATGAGGIDVSALLPAGGQVYPWAAASPTLTPGGTANFGGSAFTYTVPSGYSAWG
jgi:hypothetical protein